MEIITSAAVLSSDPTRTVVRLFPFFVRSRMREKEVSQKVRHSCRCNTCKAFFDHFASAESPIGLRCAYCGQLEISAPSYEPIESFLASDKYRQPTTYLVIDLAFPDDTFSFICETILDQASVFYGNRFFVLVLGSTTSLLFINREGTVEKREQIGNHLGNFFEGTDLDELFADFSGMHVEKMRHELLSIALAERDPLELQSVFISIEIIEALLNAPGFEKEIILIAHRGFEPRKDLPRKNKIKEYGDAITCFDAFIYSVHAVNPQYVVGNFSGRTRFFYTDSTFSQKLFEKNWNNFIKHARPRSFVRYEAYCSQPGIAFDSPAHCPIGEGCDVACKTFDLDAITASALRSLAGQKVKLQLVAYMSAIDRAICWVASQYLDIRDDPRGLIPSMHVSQVKLSLLHKFMHASISSSSVAHEQLRNCLLSLIRHERTAQGSQAAVSPSPDLRSVLEFAFFMTVWPATHAGDEEMILAFLRAVSLSEEERLCMVQPRCWQFRASSPPTSLTPLLTNIRDDAVYLLDRGDYLIVYCSDFARDGPGIAAAEQFAERASRNRTPAAPLLHATPSSLALRLFLSPFVPARDMQKIRVAPACVKVCNDLDLYILNLLEMELRH